MRIIQIKELLVSANAIIERAPGYTINSGYMLFFDNGGSYNGNYNTDSIRRANFLYNVFEFTKDERRNSTYYSRDS